MKRQISEYEITQRLTLTRFFGFKGYKINVKTAYQLLLLKTDKYKLCFEVSSCESFELISSKKYM